MFSYWCYYLETHDTQFAETLIENDYFGKLYGVICEVMTVISVVGERVNREWREFVCE